MLARCSALAARHGYLLVAPQWTNATRYNYSPEEHAAVTNVLKNLRRRFNVDSDRVFLLGVGEGGAMAFDVGLGHPDLFAGVMPMSAIPNFFSLRYSGVEVGNSQNLPFYVVHGTLAGEQLNKNTSVLFNAWIPQGYPSLHVEYNQRGLEWFAYEEAHNLRLDEPQKAAHRLSQRGPAPFHDQCEADNSSTGRPPTRFGPAI